MEDCENKTYDELPAFLNYTKIFYKSKLIEINLSYIIHVIIHLKH
jgi:hypothetical protein